MKKLLTKSLVGVVGMTLIPTVISCGNNGKESHQNQDGNANQIGDKNSQESSTNPKVVAKTIEEKTQEAQAYLSANEIDLKPMTYDQLKQSVGDHSNILWTRGIGRFALSQTCSYLINVALELGFKFKDEQLQNQNVVAPTADIALKNERDNGFNQINALMNGLKEMTDDDKNIRLSDSYYQTYNYLVSEGGSLYSRSLRNAGIDASVLGIATNGPDNDIPNNNSDFPKGTIDLGNKQTVNVFATPSLLGTSPKAYVQQFADGEKPGQMITKISIPTINDNNGNLIIKPFTKTIETTKMLPIYPIEKLTDKEHNLKLLHGLVKELTVIFDQSNNDKIEGLKKLAEQFHVSLQVIDAFKFIGEKLETQEGYTLDKLDKVYDKLNNGSHYFKAVEAILRGFADPISINTFDVHDAITSKTLNGVLYSPIEQIATVLNDWGSTLSGHGAFVFANESSYLTASSDKRTGTIADWRQVVYN